MTNTLYLDKKEAWDLALNALQHNQTSKENAKDVADALISAEIDGQTGHGLSRLPSYIEQLSSGKVDGNVNPTIVSSKGSVIRIDAKHGFAFPALSLAINELTNATKKYGIAAVSVSNSHHFGQAGRYVECLADSGLIGLMFGNTPKAIPPWGGTQALFGTNPICFGSPTGSKIPFILDSSVSVINRGKIRRAAKLGLKIPFDVALDKNGKPTNDPKKAIEGVQLPIAGFRGSGLAWMVDILSGVFTGGNHSGKVRDPFDDFSGPQEIGHLFITIKPNLFATPPNKKLLMNFLLGSIQLSHGTLNPFFERSRVRCFSIKVAPAAIAIAGNALASSISSALI